MSLEKLTIKISRVRKSHASLPLPQFMTSGAAGCDLFADIEKPLKLKPGERVLIPTGIAIGIPKGYEAQVRPRSGLAWKWGVTLPNTPGTIDSDYRGEIKVPLMNLGKKNSYPFKRGSNCPNGFSKSLLRRVERSFYFR